MILLLVSLTHNHGMYDQLGEYLILTGSNTTMREKDQTLPTSYFNDQSFRKIYE